MSKFSLEMNLDNVAMASTESIAEALRQVAERVTGQDRGLIRDYNGNTIGAWEIALDEDDSDEEYEYEDDGQGDDAWADAQTFESVYGPED